MLLAFKAVEYSDYQREISRGLRFLNWQILYLKDLFYLNCVVIGRSANSYLNEVISLSYIE